MLHKPADNPTGYVKELATRISGAKNEAELVEVISAAASEIRECVNAEKLEAAGRMAGWLAHQINNPLGAISGNAQLLTRRLQRDVSDEVALGIYLRYTEAIQSQTERCALITGVILDFSRTREPRMRRIDVMEAVDEAVQTACYGRSEVNLSVNRAQREGPLVVNTDKELLVRVLHEVIVNAIQSTAEGGSITVDAGFVPSQKDRVRIFVSDSGPGIPNDALPRVFEPFFSMREKARGLGLTTSLSIVRQLGGAIDITETGPEGTIVTVELPTGRTEK